MKQFLFLFKGKDDLRDRLSEIREKCDASGFVETLFYITWSSKNPDELDTIVEEIEGMFPKSDYYGNETSGSISSGEFTAETQIICYALEGEDTKTELVWVEQGTTIPSLEALWDYCNEKTELRGIELIPSMSYIDKLKIDCNVPKISKDILIFGGSSGNYGVNPYGAAVLAKGHPKTDSGMVVILYYGSRLHFSSYSILGWKGLGRLMEVTESSEKCIIKLDNEPAFSVYEKYLNLTPEDTDTQVFPLIVEEEGNEFIRTPHTITEDKSLRMFVNIPEGSMVRIAYGDKNTILDDIYVKAQEIAESSPEVIKAYSCTGRRMFWGDNEISRETRILEDIAPACGFYTGGEILRFGEKLRVMNQTLSIITFSESSDIESKKVRLRRKAPDKSLVSRLAYFTQKVSEEQEEIQHQLQEALNEADNANKSKTRFLFNMSHDIRTPMNAIIGYTNIALKHIDDREKTLDCLYKTQQSGNMLLSLINSVLEVSRIEAGMVTPEERYGDIDIIFRNIESTMRELADAKEIELTFENGRIDNHFVYCDFNRCLRVLVNVISNAIKYTHNGGYVRVKCEQAAEIKDGVGTYIFSVSDNGIGMSEEFQKHVFEQFAREKTATVSGIQGTGLGMAVCKSFVENMGGTIVCKSKQGVGTTFTISLPLRLPKEEPETSDVFSKCLEEENGEKTDDVLNGKRLLLVEDNEMNREIAAEILIEKGITVEEAEDGTEAVEIMKEKGPEYYDFILMDIQMPIMGGYEATGIIRKLYPDFGIPIVALSANAFTEDKMASLDAGMDAHVAKPINSRELFGILKRYV